SPYVAGPARGAGCGHPIAVPAAGAGRPPSSDGARGRRPRARRPPGGLSPPRHTALPRQYEAPFGFGGAPTYFGLITTRHMHEHGTTLEQWAQVAVSTREWARLNPKAKNREPLTIADVLNSRPVVYPFNVLNICLVTDAGGAVGL